MIYAGLTVRYTLKQLLDAFKVLVDKLQALRGKLKEAGVAADDARQVGLYGMQEAVIGFGLTAHAISGNGLKSRQRTREEVVESFDNYVTIEGKAPDQLLTLVETVWRLSLLTIFHFKLDALFQNLLIGLGAKPGRSVFGKNLKDLTGMITLKDTGRVCDVLDTPTLIRNSMHNNGIHRGADWGPITHHGLTYEFKKDKGVQCGSFGHILAALDASTDALQEILHCPRDICREEGRGSLH